MEIKCIITDDEPIARKGLKSYIERTGFLTLAGECENGSELNAMLKNTTAHLIFLDIEMPDLNGIEFLSAAVNPPQVIIVSAYEQYAIKGFELDVFDYLLKPVSYERFLRSVNKFHDRFEKDQHLPKDHIFIKSERKIKKLLLKEILFIESMENYVLIHTHTSRDIVYSTLKMIEENLPAAMFMQTHRSYIVNTEHIQAIEGNQLEIGSHKVPIARNFRDKVFNEVIARNLVVRKNDEQ